MKKTTVLIDESLLEKAMQAIGAKSKKEAIVAGLEHLVKERNKKLLLDELGSFDLDLTLRELEALRNDE